MRKNKKVKNEIAGSPVKNAVQTIQRSKYEIEQTLKLVELVTQGDKHLDCENLEQTFKTLQIFFGRGYFEFEDDRFWFLTNTNQRIGVYSRDGKFHRCIMGMFNAFRQLTILQIHNGKKILTEFYFDAENGDLMIHRYRGDERTHETYKVSGF